MSETQLFRVILKAIGIWYVPLGIADLPAAFRFSHDYPDEQAFLLMVADTFAYPVILIAAGCLLILSTDWFVRIAWPASTEEEPGGHERAAEVFGVLVKAIGVVNIFAGIARLPYDAAMAHRSASHFPYKVLDALTYPGILIIIGCFLLCATDWFVWIAWRKPTVASDDGHQDSAPA